MDGKQMATNMTDEQMKEALKTVKIGTPDEVFWTAAKERVEKDTIANDRNNEMNRHIVKYCDLRISEEKEKLKPISKA